LKFPDPTVSANTSLGYRAGTGLYRKKSSVWTIAGACFIRRRKYQIETMEAMSAIAPPTVPPTMAPKLVEGAVVLVGDGVGTLYRKKSSFWTVAGACLFRRQKYHSETMKAMSTIPPTVPPTMAPKFKLGVVEGAAVVLVVGDGGGVLLLVLVGVLVDRDEPEVGEEVSVTESADTVGALGANAPTPVSTGVGFI
jgi:hypothetical protein